MRHTLAALLTPALLTGALLTGGLTAGTWSAAPAVAQAEPPAATSAAPTADRVAPRAQTKVVLRVTGCERCTVSAVSNRGRPWASPERRVRDGRAVLRVPTARTTGMTITLRAPWQRRVNAVGHVVMAYAGQQVGDRVTRAESRDARRGSPCFAGTDARRLKLAVAVHRARFAGPGGRAVAPAAYAKVTQRTNGGFARTFQGFYGAQDVVSCGS